MCNNVSDLSKNILYNILVQPHDILTVVVACAKFIHMCDIQSEVAIIRTQDLVEDYTYMSSCLTQVSTEQQQEA